MLLEKAVFIVSVDFELAWGFNSELLLDATTARRYLEPLGKSRTCVSNLIYSLEENCVPATWAVVGHLLLDRCESENGIAHPDMPRSSLGHKDWYALDPCSDQQRDPLWYARDLVDEILDSGMKHEIASHSFSHVDFSTCSHDVALAEVRKSKELLQKMLSVSPATFIFPKSHIGHLDVLRTEGFKSYRGPIPETILEHKTAALYEQAYKALKIVKGKLARNAPIVQPMFKEVLWQIPGSLLFQKSRGISARDLLRCSMDSIRKVIKARGIFHVVLHDYSLISSDALGAFTQLLAHVHELNRERRINVSSIQDLVNALPSRGVVA